MFDAQTLAGHKAQLLIPPTDSYTTVSLDIIHYPARTNDPRRLSLLLSNTDAAALGQALIERSTHNRKGSRRLSNPTRANDVI